MASQNGLEQFYTLADALAMASWLNIFVRQADVVKIACIAQSVNVISPLVTSPTGLFRQTIFYPLYLFSKYMRGGLSVHVSATSPTFGGETLPIWIPAIKGEPYDLDVSTVIYSSENKEKSLRIAVVNRSESRCYKEVPIRVAFERVEKGAEMEVHEIWHGDTRAANGWDDPHNVVTKTRQENWTGNWRLLSRKLEREKNILILLVVERHRVVISVADQERRSLQVFPDQIFSFKD